MKYEKKLQNLIPTSSDFNHQPQIILDGWGVQYTPVSGCSHASIGTSCYSTRRRVIFLENQKRWFTEWQLAT